MFGREVVAAMIKRFDTVNRDVTKRSRLFWKETWVTSDVRPDGAFVLGLHKKGQVEDNTRLVLAKDNVSLASSGLA